MLLKPPLSCVDKGLRRAPGAGEASQEELRQFPASWLTAAA